MLYKLNFSNEHDRLTLIAVKKQYQEYPFKIRTVAKDMI